MRFEDLPKGERETLTACGDDGATEMENGNEYRLKDGSVLNNADFDQLDDQAEAGDYPGTPGEWIVRPCEASKDANGFSERDRRLLAMAGLTEEQVLKDEAIAESETIPDGLVGPVYDGLHFNADDVQWNTPDQPKSAE